MTKHEFLLLLRKGLSGLPQNDIEERLTFYGEMIDDRIEEGFSEEDAVSEIGAVDEIISQIIADIPITKLVKQKIKAKRTLGALEITLLILGSPVWLSVLIAVLAIIFSVYVVLWSVIISLWAVFGAVIGCALGGILSGIGFVMLGNTLTGVAIIGAGIVSAGVSVFSFFGSRLATKGIILLTKKMALRIKNCFIKKEKA